MVELSESEKKVLLSFTRRVDRNDPGALNNLGVLYYKKGMYEEAIAQFKEAIKLDQRFDLARENLQYLFATTDIEDPDVTRWKAEVERDPRNLELSLRLGVSYQNMGRLDEAARVLGEVVAKNPNHVMARLHLGNVLKSQGLYQQALEHYQAVSEDVGKSAVFHTDLGEIFYNIGRTDEAIAELRKAIKLDADYWRSHFLLSFAYGDNGQLQEALEESRIASKLNPSFQNTEANLALSLYGDAEESAGDTSSMAKETASIESTSFTLGAAYRERGFFKEALKEFGKALQDMVEKDRVYVEIGKVHMLQGDNAKAELSFLKALEENADSADAFRFLGCVNHMKEEYYRAAICYLQSYRLNSIDADTLNNIGVLLYQVGLKENAERMFKKGLNLKLYHMELNYNFLTCNLLKEDYMMAENLIQRLEAFMGKSALLYEKRALLHFKMNRLTLALFDLESALALDRKHSDAIYLKGLIFLREDNFNEAIEAIVEASKISKRYGGFSFFVATGERDRQIDARVDSAVSVEPDDALIELLQSGIARRFDKIKDSLVSFVDNEIKRAKEENSADDGAGGGARGRSDEADRVQGAGSDDGMKDDGMKGGTAENSGSTSVEIARDSRSGGDGVSASKEDAQTSKASKGKSGAKGSKRHRKSVRVSAKKQSSAGDGTVSDETESEIDSLVSALTEDDGKGGGAK